MDEHEVAKPGRKTTSKRRRQGWQTEQLGDNLRKAREARGLTQQEVADKIGIDKRNYGRWERGEYTLIIDDIVRLARILGVSVNQLLGLPSALSEEEDQLLAAFRAVGERERRLILNMALDAANLTLNETRGLNP